MVVRLFTCHRSDTLPDGRLASPSIAFHSNIIARTNDKEMESPRFPVPLVPYSFLLCIQLLLLLQSAHSRPISAPEPANYHTLDIAAWLIETKTAPAPGRDEYEKRETKPRQTPWSVQVVHRDSLLVKDAANATASYERRLEETLRRDARRVRGLEQRIEKRLRLNKDPAGSHENVAEVAAEFGGEVVSGMAQGSGEYFTRIGVGTPMREQYMVLDTGSDVVWIQCEPCSKCYSQVDPIFNPSLSASFSTLGCNSAVCSYLDAYNCHGGGCLYKVSYGDGSYTIGSFATEMLTFGTTSVRNVAIGCGHDNAGLFVGAAGLLGLGAGLLSFPSQLGTQTGRAFSYCLVDRFSESSGTLEFGPESVPLGSILTPLLTNPSLPTFYYVPLISISVGGALLDSVPPDVFRIDETSGRGGFIVDSGTAVTRLQTPVYDAVRDAFVAGTRQLPKAEGVSIFDTCYDLSGLPLVNVPTVVFHFSNGASLILPAKNYMIPMDFMGTFCFAFAPATSDLSIMGNIQQQGIRVSFDTANSLVGFALRQC
uniref:Peptidase A1 domain-containing protein n=1 Tax=Picea sitchensis TaxID=3332 RepID=B8LLE4_PICSI|nr:unknown [Picea sitchensis]